MRPMPGGQLAVAGPPDHISFLAPAIRLKKQALLSGACSLCGDDLATVLDRCRWCAAVRGRWAFVRSEDEWRFTG